jgi:hypothetical protein
VHQLVSVDSDPNALTAAIDAQGLQGLPTGGELPNEVKLQVWISVHEHSSAGSLVAVSVFLTVHVTIVLYVAFGKISFDILVALHVTCSQISMFVSVDGVEISMRRGLALRIDLAVVCGVGSRAREDQCGAGQ